MDQVIQRAASLLKELEGLRLDPYQCPAGKWTIGYGHNLEANGLTADEAKQVDFDADVIDSDIIDRWCNSGMSTTEIKGILPKYLNAIKLSKEAACYILESDINNFIRQLVKHEYFNNAPNNVKTALICICFQCGFVGMSTNIYIMTRKLPFSAAAKDKRVYFIDYIRRGEYENASGVLRSAPIFRTTKKRAIRMADLIFP